VGGEEVRRHRRATPRLRVGDTIVGGGGRQIGALVPISRRRGVVVQRHSGRRWSDRGQKRRGPHRAPLPSTTAAAVESHD